MNPTQRTELSEHGIHVWRFPLIAARQEITSLSHWLSEQEKNALDRLVSHRDRDKRLVAWGRLRYILSRYLTCSPEEICMEREPSGRPEITQPKNVGLQFSLTHSGSLGLVGVAAGVVGIDIERVRFTKGIDRLAARFFSKQEAEGISQRPVTEQAAWFFRVWVLKEAYLKSMGMGVPAGLSQCEIEWGPSGPSILSHGAASQNPARTLLEIPVSKGYVAALAVSPQSTDVTVFDL